jgi:L-iditol 2-dehydrogenase
MGVPATMCASVLRGVRDLVVEERPVPVPGPGDALIRVLAAAVSGSDATLYASGRLMGERLGNPLVLGRAASGQIVAVGEGVPVERIGQPVALEPMRVCRRCPQCRAGRYNLCQFAEFLATPGCDGVFQEYVCLPADFAHPVPVGLSAEAAALIEPMSVGLAALQRAHVGAGSRILVSGAGAIGLTTVGVAKALGAVEITITDLSAERLERARGLGATTTLNMATSGIVIPRQYFDAFIECSGSAAAVRRGFPAVRPAGRVVLVGRGADEVAMPVTLMQNRELTVCGSFRYANTFPTAIAMAAAGMVDLAPLADQHGGLGDLAEALEFTRAANGGKAMIRPAPDPD